VQAAFWGNVSWFEFKVTSCLTISPSLKAPWAPEKGLVAVR
jgi:hypothetical protein